MFGSMKMYLMIGMGVMLMAAAAGAWYIYNDMQGTIKQQAGVIAIQTIQIEQSGLIIEQNKADSAKQSKITASISKDFNESRKEVDALRAKFNKLGNSSRITRDIGKLAIARPGLIERVINKGTKDALRCVEIISGAKLTAHEEAATKKSQINNACPDIANPSYIPY